MYTEKVMDHFEHPRNVGEIENASGVGTVGNAKCGDIMRIYLDIDENQIIRDIKFKTFGCGAAVATSSMATELVKGKNIKEAMQVTNKAVMEALDGLPPVKVHCSLLAEEAIHAALWDYAEKNGIQIEGLEKPKSDIHEDEEEELVQEENGGCCGLSAVEDARRVAASLDIPYYVMNFKQEFKTQVIDYFIREYQEGRTPNPCIACNRYVKWESLLKRSMQIGADYIATGHYARIDQLPNGRYSLRTSATGAKDQTYALYNLTQEQLRRTIMPVGAYTKEEIRAMAEKLGLLVADKPDSQDICFIPDGDYASYIEENTNQPVLPGNFVTTDGTVVGKHKGIVHYTVGQRKGLGLSLGHPVFVLEIRPETNEVVVGSHEESLSRYVRADHVNYMAIEDLDKPMRAWAKIRYNHKGAWCTVEKTGEDEILCVFDEPQRAITPGQAVVLYEDEYVLLGGTIGSVK